MDFFSLGPGAHSREKYLSRGHRIRMRPMDSVLTHAQRNLARGGGKCFRGKRQVWVPVGVISSAASG